MRFSFPQVNTTNRVMENESKALCSTVLLLAGTYAICILPAAHKCGNLSYITTAHERHHLKKKTEILIRSAPGVACHSVAPGDQLVEGGYLLNLYSL
jgi:hypothetical protein